MKRILNIAGPSLLVASAVLVIAGVAAAAEGVNPKEYKSGKIWQKPKVIDPGKPGEPPSDAIVLFNGKDMSAWEAGEFWTIEDGVATVGGNVRTKQAFGDCQLHIEWATPTEITGDGQGRGNSGVYFMGKYELQILDSYENETYYDGQAGSLYKQSPPLVNASRKPGEWQTYDIVFMAPRFDSAGKLTRPCYVTVLHNGVLVQNHTELSGGTAWAEPPKYTAHPEKLPLTLQHHRNPVRFRNIWIRELEERPEPKFDPKLYQEGDPEVAQQSLDNRKPGPRAEKEKSVKKTPKKAKSAKKQP